MWPSFARRRGRSGPDAIARALATPIGAPPFEVLVRDRTSACVPIRDVTRPVPNKLFLRPMIEQMLAAAIPRERITVLVASPYVIPQAVSTR